MRYQFFSRVMLTALLAASFLAAGSGSGPAVASLPGPSPRWLPPLGASLSIAAPFRAPAHRYAAGHRGFDLVAVPGASVAAPASGTVTFAGRVVDRDVISVQVDAVTVVSLEPITSTLTRGDTVAAGGALGEVSRGGHCDGACVHLGVRVDDWYVNPMRFFRDKPILLPWNEAG
ncbi:M23 family metallopeptidase [Leucobacter sp. HY1908]